MTSTPVSNGFTPDCWLQSVFKLLVDVMIRAGKITVVKLIRTTAKVARKINHERTVDARSIFNLHYSVATRINSEIGLPFP